MANTTGKKFGGRKKGVANKSTLKAKEAISMFVDENSHRLTKWLDQVAEENPAEAFKLFQSVIEYHVPKLSRQEMQPLGKDGEKSDWNVTVNIPDADKN